jgi:hypothetical protein
MCLVPALSQIVYVGDVDRPTESYDTHLVKLIWLSLFLYNIVYYIGHLLYENVSYN